ncbi:MAG: thioesterase family protein [Parafilimonas sp.]|nr:thioesterase family protein [Parafilimonas sp.]
MIYIKNVEIRWSDLDPNYHLRHSAYYDFGAYCRICFLYDNGITDKLMRQQEIGPILFREKCRFKREIIFGDRISITLKLKSVSSDFRKFSMLHEIYKNDNELAALLTIDAAWMSTSLRKVIIPPQIIIDSLDVLEKTDDFILT